MIACGESQGGEAEEGLASPRNPFAKLAQELLPVPLAFGAADVDLVTGTETSPHITQSETYTTANPDNPNQVVVAYNDSRCAATNNFSALIGLHRRRTDLHPRHQRQRLQPLRQYLWRPSCSVQQADPDLVHRLARCGTAAVRASAGTSRPLPRTQIAGPISAFTPAAATTASLAGPTTTPSSPFFGRMYVSWNDFNVGAGRSGRQLLHR